MDEGQATRSKSMIEMEKMDAFTPGPWEAIPQNGAGPMIAHPYETGKQMNPIGLRLVCHVLARGGSLKEDQANARLISAAPDMYAALAELRELFDDKQDITNGGGPNDAMRAVQIIDAALTKAGATHA